MLILLDWDGKVTRDAGFNHTDRTARVMVLDSQGKVAGAYQGNDLADHDLALLESADMGGRS